ncbi:putative quinol monooxygenase [Fusibacter ferrireducens]|uniref:Antibiotic biosynthesis monooxygenase n=1 Tax=Fusibacter ferrireducens TaxID=2785058 RepID=A0ABR9ZR01_9FIRM|nr:putative quinol monooxygenase [Fusibacter ferrireducens]MBF4692859.1 antibiotic biosynthesis monooxygenase [Fusibacter ferrireducens]
MIKVVARSVAIQGKEDEIIALSKELVLESRKEVGCIRYEMYQDQKNASVFTMIETWQDEETFQKHKETPHVKRIVPQLNALRVEKAVVDVYTLVI